MPRDNREIKLTPVDDAMANRAPVIRLESRETLDRAKKLRHGAADQEAMRLDVPNRDDFEVRTHEPDTSLMSSNGKFTRSFMDLPWDDEIPHHGSVLWGSVLMIALSVAGFAVWSLNQTQNPTTKSDPILVAPHSTLANEVSENLEASQLIDRIEAATRRYFATTDPGTLSGLSRQPERVAPLIARYYQDKPILPNRVTGTLQLQPLTLDRRGDFWMHTVQMEDKKPRKVVIEVVGSGDPKIDWEAFVGHQPMKWDDFARERPTGAAMDFRVYLEPDHFFSHEFADASRWNCFRLTTLQNEETLFGYVEHGSPISEELLKRLSRSERQKIAVILRLSVPTGFESRRGVVIEKLVSPCWIHLDPPDA